MKLFSRFIPVALYSVMIFYLSHQTQPPAPDLGFEWQDKVYHCGAYFIYGMLLIIALSSRIQITNTKVVVEWILGIGGLFALSDEIHQYFIPGRSCEFYDWIADMVGLSIAVILIHYNVKKISNGEVHE